MAIPFREHLAGPYDALVHDVMQSAIRNQVVERLWSKDHRLWKPEPTEIADRLGLPLGTVLTRMRRGIESVRKKLESQKGSDP